MQIRAPQAADLDHLARLWHEGWHDAHAALVPPAWARARPLELFHERVAAAHAGMRVTGPPGTPLGFFMLRGEELWQFYLARPARGTGIAAALMAQAEAELARRGIVAPWLDCAAGNNRAARFYEKSGWSRARTEVKRLETAERVLEIEVWIYQKSLP
ncbi:MAG: GNAT family N-acetyltransferase [Alphaproteobacteria bacterium]|nr:MAG: GNAT family N-acetyltransferase [Alphaproteobacteria bacterium]